MGSLRRRGGFLVVGAALVEPPASTRQNGAVATVTLTSAETRLRELLAERIVVLDGAWGTMLQREGLTDADYRGERFRDHPHEVAGDPDILNLTRPDVVLDIHRAYPDAGAG